MKWNGRKVYMKGMEILKILCAGVLIVFSVYAFLIWEGILFIGEPINRNYSVRGIQVSAKYGKIDWTHLKKDMNLTFVYIKATEGKKGKDSKFEQNWKLGKDSGLYVGAYHEFSLEQDGEKQAKNFISRVSATPNTLPPMVKIVTVQEQDGIAPDPSKVKKQLKAYIRTIQWYYNQTPIIYTDMDGYYQYIDREYQLYQLWIKNVTCYPFIKENRQWIFWEYKETQPWTYGGEKQIGLSVFDGSYKNFQSIFGVK